jgi:uncharacterized protein (DUF2249 family)
MNTENILGADRMMDVRALPCAVKHGLIVKTCQDLAVGEHFILWNSHDPVPLRQQLTNHWPGAFAWQYLVQGPEEFQIRITKLKALATEAAPAALNCGDH